MKEFDKFFKDKFIGQNHVLDLIKQQLINIVYDIDDDNTRPAGVFLFVGPTGVGKTEMCKLLSEFLYNNKDINRFDMSEYKSDMATQQMLGAPNGYIGYEEGGTLINAMKRNPNSIVLFDEIEKANKCIFDLFLQIFDEGIVTSNMGEKISFKNNFIILTSNIGSNKIESNMTLEQIEQITNENIKHFFYDVLSRPEILGRIGKENIITFNLINKQSDLFKIVDIYLNSFLEQDRKSVV